MPDARDEELAHDLAKLEAHVRATQGDAAWEVVRRTLNGPDPKRKRSPLTHWRVGTKEQHVKGLSVAARRPTGEPAWRELEDFKRIREDEDGILDRLRRIYTRRRKGDPCPICGKPIPVGDEAALMRSGRIVHPACVPAAIRPTPASGGGV
jgi:hypothetical protein